MYSNDSKIFHFWQCLLIYRNLRQFLNLCLGALIFYWTLDFSQTASYKITLVRLYVLLSIHLSVRRSLNFLKIGLLVFSDIVRGDIYRTPWYIVIGGAKFLGKNWSPKFWANRSKSGAKLVFLPFSEVWFISFLLNCMGW